MRIDSHHHLWNLKEVFYPWLMEKGEKRFFGDPTPIQQNYLLNDYLKSARESSIQSSVHIQVGAYDGYQEALWVQAIADTNPNWPLVQVAFCDLASEDVEFQLTRLQQLSTVVGIRQIVGRSHEEDRQSGTNALIANPKFKDGMALVEKMGFSFDLQITPHLFGIVSEFFAAFPKLKIALCHAGSPLSYEGPDFEKWRQGINLFASLPVAHCKISGLPMFFHQPQTQAYAPIIETCLSAFDVERCMFGSNFPVDSLYTTYTELVNCYEQCVPSEFHDVVFGQTARNFYFLNR